MLSLAQKLIAIGVTALLAVLMFLFSPILGIVGLFAVLPFGFAILRM